MVESTPAVVSVGMVLFPGFTLLDLAGPYDVFSRMPGARVSLVAATLESIHAEKGVALSPDIVFEDAPNLDLLFVPGGPGQQLVMEDARVLAFLRERVQTVRLLASVCTGALILGAAGLLQGYRATTHWRYLELLRLLGAEPIAERVVVDGNRITGAGVSAGIDLALRIASIFYDERVAKSIALGIEYDPQPPFWGGSPKSADPDILARLSASLDEVYEKRRAQIERIKGQQPAAPDA